MNRRDFLKVVAGTVGTAAISNIVWGRARQKLPNIVIILTDDLGYGDLNCYGHPYIQSPNIDKLAQEGIRYTNCYAAASVCSPARAGMLTGRNPQRVGVYGWIAENENMYVPESETTIPELLKTRGYKTCLIGKFHCNGMFDSPFQPQPDDHGFD